MVRYVIISPVRNEEKFIGKTLHSVINQTIRPVEWIIVNDGSTDHTESIIDEYACEYQWIKKIDLQDRGFYYPGKGVVAVFNVGYKQLTTNDWEYLVKLDCDLTFDQDYFERVFKEFHQNPRLGIASGCTYKPVKHGLIREPIQEDHPVGPSKIYKRACWEAIGGMLPVPGWDLADLLSAQMKNWETVCFYELVVVHYRQTGSRRKGIFAPKFLQGRYTYRHGYSFMYTVLREFFHLFRTPPIIGSIAIILGYIKGYLLKEEYLFPEDIRDYLRARHRKFLLKKIGLRNNTR